VDVSLIYYSKSSLILIYSHLGLSDKSLWMTIFASGAHSQLVLSWTWSWLILANTTALSPTCTGTPTVRFLVLIHQTKLIRCLDVHAISNDAGRSLMGSAQENWFLNQLSASSERGAAWRVVGNQIIFSRINESIAYGNENPFDYDAWDGYLASRNRTLNHLYENKINNTIFLSGDSHASWVSDIVWLDTHAYNASTGEGSIGVEFAGSAVSSPSPAGQNVTLAFGNVISSLLTADNIELQWQDVYYRGYYELDISYDAVEAQFFGLPTIATRDGWEISLANFTVKSGENKLFRTEGVVGGGTAESGSLKGGKITGGNVTVDTATGEYFISNVTPDTA
jgi:alkaline phosphatase D